MKSTFLARASTIKAMPTGNFDLSDPDRKPGMDQLLHDAYQSLQKDEREASALWNTLCEKVKGTELDNRVIQRGITDRKFYISFKIPRLGRLSMFDSDVVLYLDKSLVEDEHASSIGKIWRSCGVSLYAHDFGSYGNGYREGFFNGLRVGYYRGLAGAPGKARFKAIVKTVVYLKKAMKT